MSPEYKYAEPSCCRPFRHIRSGAAILFVTLFGLILAPTTATSVQGNSSEEITRCDELASSEYDLDRVAAAVSLVELVLNRTEAFRACLAALEENPRNRRIMALLVRVESVIDPEPGGPSSIYAKTAADMGNTLGMYLYARDAYARSDLVTAANYLAAAIENGPSSILEAVVDSIRTFRPQALSGIVVSAPFQSWLAAEIEANSYEAKVILGACLEAGHHCEQSTMGAYRLYDAALGAGDGLSSSLLLHLVLKNRAVLFNDEETFAESFRTAMQAVIDAEETWTPYVSEYLYSICSQVLSGLYGSLNEFPDGGVRQIHFVRSRAELNN